MRKVMVVDDEPKIVQLARDYLEHAGFAVVVAHDGEAALATARAQKPDLVVLDLGLPELDGLDVARTLRRESNVPIVMLTGRSEESDKLVGLEIGADDYVTKPFSPKELVARVRAICLRSTGSAPASRIWTSERRRVGLLASAAAVVAGERAVPAATWLGRAGLGAGRLHAAHGDVLRRGRGLLGGRGDGPLLDARHRARIARHGGQCRARRGAARGVVRLLAGGEIASSD